MKAKQHTSSTPTATTSMWQLIETVADMERRVGRIYTHFAEMFPSRPGVAAFWRDVAADERMHASLVKSARDVFPATAPAPEGNWPARLTTLDARLKSIEAELGTRLPLVEAMARAEALEGSELNLMTGMVLDRAEATSAQFGRLGKLWRVDAHAAKMADARARFCRGERKRSSRGRGSPPSP